MTGTAIQFPAALAGSAIAFPARTVPGASIQFPVMLPDGADFDATDFASADFDTE